ncbi:MAG: methylated-DNA--[protein]-cysteine S-methyltransferase [Gammaproteobacteria bacterium]|nr:methylated-DNA--[protein]-cysteine S-methyltransferase [Gammaproteobacteria bacterium]MYF68116.1 methylated-DNA--[protein]-cysteine S-methyltransferase [Gammaproteobacteria bacterium]MYK37601.1 methylated-DNA--[protein]-cysteine S-methyltransferase [Gammaproteobacteria bacterium]
MRKIDIVPPTVRARLEDRDRTPARGRSLTAGFASSPLGRLMLAEVDGALCRVGYVDARERGHDPRGRPALEADEAENRQWQRLARRWPGARLERDDEWAQGRADGLFSSGGGSVDVLLRGTAFQLAVWKALLGVPAGSTESYGGLAQRVRKPGASRAVGGAMNANPVAWLVPCHRIVAGDGGLCGYGGGLSRKRRLLAAEGIAAA